MALSISVFTVVSALTVIAAAVLIAVQTVLSLGASYVIAAYALIAVSFITLLASNAKIKVAAKLFELTDTAYMRAVSYLCAAGFAADTVAYLVKIYECVSDKTHSVAAIPLFSLSMVFSLLSAFEFMLVAMSFGDDKYNFKRFSLIAFTPLLWAAVKISGLLLGYVNVAKPSDFFFFFVVAACLLFFYRFAYEAFKDAQASRLTLYFADVMTMCGALYFVSRVSLVIADTKNFFDYENLFAVIVLFIALFSFTLKIRIVKYGK